MAKTKETSTNNQNKIFIADCNVTYAVHLVGGRWKLPILLQLEKEKKRFGELKKIISNITERMLTLQLRELEKDGLVTRTVYAEVPPRVEYELTNIGKELMPVCTELHQWGAKHKMGLIESDNDKIK
ncbi:helix-turn-helix transcriptional regulator [Chryseobacterium sp. C-71]|uniref:winged helix-turn-helix transcriptional regulator n=1 Tax=Chryseobacterium sp. C-71 TaxID=2893882 RepID=UPI001E357EC4|nr:helix-turn-helix domain-containing protein [Chryseobacterium sp. C-71]UFH33013.1 helix-turn-helix transcriptional regulator [Chryseobacterium sp. C-71]